MIAVDITEKSYGKSPILGPVTFQVPAGQTVAVLGPSGVGKTTLLRIVAGIDPAFSGRVQRPDNLAIVFQEPTLLPWRTCLQNLMFVHRGVTVAQAEKALGQVGLKGKGHCFPNQLSLGQQRRLSLARAFAGSPEGLIMDEPFASLDKDTADAMLTLTEQLVATYQPATLIVTHSPYEADRLSARQLKLVPTPRGSQLKP